MRYVSVIVVLLLWSALAPGGERLDAQGAGLAAAVDRFYPDDRLQPSSDAERYACFQELDGPAGQAGVILAAYTDRSGGVVRVLRRTGTDGFEVAFDSPPTWDLSGRDCAVGLDDVDLDGQPEAFVYFFSTRASSGWIFRWDGATLKNLTATEIVDGRQRSIMLGPTVYDLNHEGGQSVVAAREIPVTAPGVPPRNPAFVYRLGPSGFEVEGTLLAVMGFRADVGSGANQRFFRLVTDSAPPFTLRVINGDRDGSNRVDGATVSLNNVVVLGPEQINASTEFVTLVLPEVFTTNELQAELTGAPDARMIVIVEDGTAR
jgi:hypothetical protein